MQTDPRTGRRQSDFWNLTSGARPTSLSRPPPPVTHTEEPRERQGQAENRAEGDQGLACSRALPALSSLGFPGTLVTHGIGGNGSEATLHCPRYGMIVLFEPLCSSWTQRNKGPPCPQSLFLTGTSSRPLLSAPLQCPRSLCPRNPQHIQRFLTLQRQSFPGVF